MVLERPMGELVVVDYRVRASSIDHLLQMASAYPAEVIEGDDAS